MSDKVNGSDNVINLPSTGNALLKRMKLAEWLGHFAMTLGATPPGREPVPMTPFRQGAITKLNMSSEYITALERELFWLARDNRGLRRQVQHLGGTVPPPFRPEAEAVHGADEETEHGSSDDSAGGAKQGDDDQGGNGR